MRDELPVPLLLPLGIACAGGIAVAMSLPGVTVRAWAIAAIWAATIALFGAAGPTKLLGRLSSRLSSRCSTGLSLAALLFGGFAFGGMRLAHSVHTLPADHLGRMSIADEGGRVLLQIEAIAIERPRRIAPRGALARYDHRPPRWRFRAALRAVHSVDATGARQTHAASGAIWMSVSEDAGARPPTVTAGDRFSAIGWLRPPSPPMNPGAFDARRSARLSGTVGSFTADAEAVRHLHRERSAVARLWRLRGAMRAHGDAVLSHALPRHLDAEPRGLIRAMLLGERHEGLDDLEPAFRRTGLAHLLAISGFHLAVLAGAAAMLARGPSMATRRAALAVAAGVIPYLLMVEAQPSVLRAGAMLLAIAAASVLGRGWNAGATLSLALLAIIIPWPGDLARPGLQLSFAVVAGLVWLAPRVRERWFAPPDRHASTFREFLAERARAAAAIAITAWLVSTPLILYHFGMASPLAAPLSLIAIPIAAVLLVGGHFTLAFTPLIGDLCHVPGAIVALLAELLIAFVRHADTLPGVVVFRPSPSLAWLFVALASVAAIALAPSTMPTPRLVPRRAWPPRIESLRRNLVRWHDRSANPLRRYGIPLLAAAVLAWPLRPPPPLSSAIAMRIDMLSVGDGTCILLRSGDRALLYDAGSTDLGVGGRTLVPALRALGVRHLDAIIVSHADADHYAGIPEIAEAFTIGAVIVTDELLERVHARPGPLRTTVSAIARRGIPIELAAAGQERMWSGARLRWLHPPSGWRTERSNDHSQVILVEVAGRSILLCGDIEDAAVAVLRSAHPHLRVDVVELPHHGSWRRPATELVVALEPNVILQSTAARRLEHDRWAPLLAERLPTAQRLATARDGAVWVEVRGDGIALGDWRNAATGNAGTCGERGDGRRFIIALRALLLRSSPVLLAESYVHTLDPVLLPIAGGFAIRWYGLAYVTGFVVGWLLLRWMVKTGRTPLTALQLGDLVTAIIIGVLVGGRVGHAILYEPSLLYTFESSIPFWKLLAIHKGGMSSHGGIAGVILACAWMARRHRLSIWHLIDLAAFAAPVGLGLGRLANLINGELWGRALPASMRDDPPWWSIKYPTEVLLPNFPNADRLDALTHLVDPARPFPHSLVDAAYAGNATVIERLAPLLTPHWPSQAFQAITDGPILMALLVAVWWRPRKPGVVASWFVIGYGAMRLLTEQFREPDDGVLWIGPLTLPMALSVLMIVVGILMVVVNARRPGEKMGGMLNAEC